MNSEDTVAVGLSFLAGTAVFYSSLKADAGLRRRSTFSVASEAMSIPNEYVVDSSNGVFRDAAIGRRVCAYLIDILPILVGVTAIAYLALDFNITLERYLNRDSTDTVAMAKFLVERNRIRDISFLFYLLYSAILEGSTLQGTVGKWMLGLRVVDASGQPLTAPRSFARNAIKIVSSLAFGLGFAWAMFSNRKQAWHDIIADTFVEKKSDLTLKTQ
jgi:uncharacterized RDD family membrane protein YckC